MKLFFFLLLFVAVVAFGLTFSLKNPQLVEINYYPDVVISTPLVVVLLVTLLLGVLIGLLAMSLSQLRRRRELSRARKEVLKLTEEVQNLRALPIKDSV
ncbi:MAG: lipopolysaccharide assembly protein LapA domain-containing protein [Gammaproteobacteria bacterium]|nr:lipopolysaccharide assembly protein LapA domain-containing protein [Gammaproteobacteria bacterium]MDX2486962.1 lipopolysaccharide assembly protein LapA domain-containing protein [Gammaproteobacteria bacterium]